MDELQLDWLGSLTSDGNSSEVLVDTQCHVMQEWHPPCSNVHIFQAFVGKKFHLVFQVSCLLPEQQITGPPCTIPIVHHRLPGSVVWVVVYSVPVGLGIMQISIPASG